MGFQSGASLIWPITTVLGLSNTACKGTPPKDSKALSKARMSGSTFSVGATAKGTYGDHIHRAFKMTRQGVRWRFQRLLGDIYISTAPGP